MSELPAKNRNLVLAATSIGAIMTPLLGTMIILAMPLIGTEFSVSARDLGWLSTAFILANAICLVPASWFVDKIGYKKSYIIGTAVVAVACFLSVFAPNYGALIALRVITGAGISLVMITSIAILTRIFPKTKRGFVIGINTTMVYVGLTLGPFLGGVLTDAFGWQSLFLLAAPLVAISGIFILIFLKTEFTEPVAKFDKLGTLLYAAATFCLMYGISTITDKGSLILAAVGLALFIVFIIYELRRENPILHIGLFTKNKRFARSSYAALLNYASSYAVVYMLSLYLQSIGQLSATEAGLIMLFQSLIQVIFTPVTGKLADKIDPKYLATAGMALTIAGLVLLSGIGLSGADARGYIMVIQVLIGLGVALFSAPNTTTIMNSVPKQEYSTASGIIAVVRQYGMLISMGICMAAISVFVGSTELLNEAMYADFAFALKVSMLICAGLAAIGLLFSWFRGKAPADVSGEEQGQKPAERES